MKQLQVNASRLWLCRAAWRAAFAALAAGALLLGAAPAQAAGGEHAEVNYFYGLFGESAEIDEPDWMYRKPGMPVPLAAQVFNSLILFGLLYRFGKGPIQEGLRKRRESILREVDAAAKMKSEAERQLAEHEAKLEQIDSEIVRLKREMREAAQAERSAILAEAKKRRERMEREAQLLITQELKAAREELFATTVKIAMQSARELVAAKSNAEDHVRLSEEYLAGLRASLTSAPANKTGGGAA